MTKRSRGKLDKILADLAEFLIYVSKGRQYLLGWFRDFHIMEKSKNNTENSCARTDYLL